MSIKKIYNLLICIICLLTLKLNSLFQIKIFAGQNMSASGSFCGDITTFMAMQWLCNDFRNDVKACLSTLRYIAEPAKLSQIQFHVQVRSPLGLSLRAG